MRSVEHDDDDAEILHQSSSTRTHCHRCCCCCLADLCLRSSELLVDAKWWSSMTNDSRDVAAAVAETIRETMTPTRCLQIRSLVAMSAYSDVSSCPPPMTWPTRISATTNDSSESATATCSIGQTPNVCTCTSPLLWVLRPRGRCSLPIAIPIGFVTFFR